MIFAALDPGSVHCGIAACDESMGVVAAEQVDIVNGDASAAATAIVAWLAYVGAASLVIEWAPAWMSGDKAADMARAKHRDAQQPILYHVARLCRERGIACATDATIAASRGPGLIGVSTWRSTIGALSVKDPATGRWSTKDAAVRAALIRLLGADAVAALGPGDHRRDAAGLLLGSLLAPPVGDRAAGDKRHRSGDRHVKRAGRWSSPHRVEYHREDARLSAQRARATKRAAIDPATLLPARLAAALASGGLRQGELARALGYSPGGLAFALRPYLVPGGADGVEVVAPAKQRGLYTLAQK